MSFSYCGLRGADRGVKKGVGITKLISRRLTIFLTPAVMWTNAYPINTLLVTTGSWPFVRTHK